MSRNWLLIVVFLVGNSVNERVFGVPVFTQRNYILSVAEEQGIDVSVAQVLAIESTTGLPGQNYVYSLLDGDDSDSFRISNTTGVVYNRVRLDREAVDNVTGVDKIYHFRVHIRDSSSNNDTSPVTIYLIDVNDHYPDFQQETFFINLLEDSVPSTTVTVVSAHDPDKVQRSEVLLLQPDGTLTKTYRYDISNGRVLYSLIAGNELGYFLLNGESGAITLTSKSNGQFDVTLNQLFNLTVTATDGGNLTDTANLLIRITDANDHAPVIEGPSELHFNLSEATPPGITLLNSINVTDDDFGVNANITFSIESGNLNNGFDINPHTGQIRTANSLDRDSSQGPIMFLVVVARDGGVPHLEDKITITVLLSDVNDNPPAFPSDPINGSVSEGAFSNTEVLVLNAQDPDEGINSSVVYRLITGDDGLFSLDTITGKIRTRVVLDREQNSFYSLTVAANDLAVNESLRQTSTVLVHIYVTDLNDNVPQFEQTFYYVGLLDNTTIGSSVLQITATDADAGANAEIRYETLFSERNAFDVNEDTGIIRSKINLNFQVKQLYMMTVRAWDKGSSPRYTDTSITLEIHDVNENPPVFLAHEYNVTVTEDAAIGFSVLSVSARDRDNGPIGDITYHVIAAAPMELFEEGAGTFEVNRTTGEVFVNSSLDRDQRYICKHSYNFYVLANREPFML